MTSKKEERIKKELEELSVDYPNEDAIDQTIFTLYEYVPEGKKTKKDFKEQIKDVIILSGKEFFYISPYFWVANVIFLFLGIMSTVFFYADPLVSLFILSPLPFLTGLLEVFKSRDYGMAELEGTFKYTVEQLIFSRLFIVSLFNLILNILLIACIFVSVDITFQMTQLVIYWMMPVAVTSAFGLFMATKFRGTIVSPILLSSWLILGFFIVQIPSLLKNISLLGSLTIIVLSICITFNQLKKMKGENFIEFNG